MLAISLVSWLLGNTSSSGDLIGLLLYGQILEYNDAILQVLK